MSSINKKKIKGSQFFDFLHSPKNIWRYGGEQLDACTHWPKGVKKKSKAFQIFDLESENCKLTISNNILFSKIQIIVGAQLVTLSWHRWSVSSMNKNPPGCWKDLKNNILTRIKHFWIISKKLKRNLLIDHPWLQNLETLRKFSEWEIFSLVFLKRSWFWDS